MLKFQYVKKMIFLVLLIVMICSVCTAETATNTTPEPYTKNEFPMWAKDLRRTEIISFGSLPFVTLGVTIGFGSYKYATGELASFPNPFNKSSATYTTDEQMKIIELSAVISVGLGLTDFVINSIMRANKENRLKKIQDSKEKVIVTPLTAEDAAALLRRNAAEQPDSDQKQQNADDNKINAAEQDKVE